MIMFWLLKLNAIPRLTLKVTLQIKPAASPFKNMGYIWLCFYLELWLRFKANNVRIL